MSMSDIEVITNELNKAFCIFNDKLFESRLPEPVVLVQANIKTLLKMCVIKEDTIEKSEIRIRIELLNKSFEEIMEMLLHKMCHLLNHLIGIKDTTRNGTYHNTNFKELAEFIGLNTEYCTKYGWSITTLGPSLIELLKTSGINKDALTLRRYEGQSGGEVKKQSMRKYICPVCKTPIRATKDVNVICGICKVDFVKVGTEEIKKGD